MHRGRGHVHGARAGGCCCKSEKKKKKSGQSLFPDMSTPTLHADDEEEDVQEEEAHIVPIKQCIVLKIK